VLQEIDIIRRSDTDMEARIKKLGNWGCALWVMFVLGIGGTILFWPFALVTVALLVVAIVLQLKKRRLTPFDVEDRRYELVARILATVGGDLEPREPVSVALNLQTPTHASKLSGKSKVGRWDVSFYRDAWLWLTGSLLDGSSFELTLCEHRQDRSCWTRNARGKSKHKTKTKSKEVVSLALSVSARKHPALERIAAQAAPAIQLPPFARPLGLTSKQGVVRLKAALDGSWDEPAPGADAVSTSAPRASSAISMMFLSLYNVVQLARKASKRAAA
jgi:hypothetical protein